MERWCFRVLLMLCLVSVMWNVVKADDQNFRDHSCTYFARMDYDGDFKLTLPDFISMAFAILKTDVSAPIAELLKVEASARQLFGFFPLVDVNILQATLTGVTFDQFMTSIWRRRCTPELKKQIRDLADFIHTIFNSDGADKNLTKNEFSHVYKVYRIDASAVDAGFNDLDHNHDNVITVAECNNDGQLYFCEAPLLDASNSWAGPIIKCVDLVKGDRSKLPY